MLPDDPAPPEDADEDDLLEAAEDPEAAAEAAAEPEEEEEEIEFADHPVPSEDEIRAALDWAFEGEEAPAEFLDACARHALLVLEGNRRMNLTKIVEPKEVAAKHYLDCWRTTRLLPLLGRAVLDAGTGAGFPGVPIALAEPNARVHLIDSTKKKADFVGECLATMEIPNATAEWGRAEEHLLRNRYDVVVMRAISSVRENVRLLRKVRHSLYDLVMMKGPSWSREVRAGEREAERLGFRLDTILEHELPGELGGRAVLVYRAPGGQGR
jgi:16S rRNA (guanine527-N7)-methyltransferase